MFANLQLGNRYLCFITSFQLGFPLAACKTKKGATGWCNVKKDIITCFLEQAEKEFVISSREVDKNIEHESTDYFALDEIFNDPENRFPLGEPLIMQYKYLTSSKIFSDLQISFCHDKSQIDHMIWICPTGTVLIIACIPCADTYATHDLLRDKLLYPEYYKNFVGIFAKIANITLRAFNNVDFGESILYCRKYMDSYSEIINIVDKKEILDKVLENPSVSDNIVQDIYYINFLYKDLSIPNVAESRMSTESTIGYVYSQFSNSDKTYLLLTTIAYCSFMSLLGLTRHLQEEMESLEIMLQFTNSENKNTPNIKFAYEKISHLKMFRVFCLRFINESNPLSIRLREEYMKCIQNFWENSFVYSVIQQLNELFDVLDGIFEWMTTKAETEIAHRQAQRERQISTAALIIAIISITAVTAQLISTIDVNSSIGAIERSVMIFIGFIIGTLISTMVFFKIDIPKKRKRKSIKNK